MRKAHPTASQRSRAYAGTIGWKIKCQSKCKGSLKETIDEAITQIDITIEKLLSKKEELMNLCRICISDKHYGFVFRKNDRMGTLKKIYRVELQVSKKING